MWFRCMWFFNVFFWALTYILLIAYMVKYKTIGIPVIAMIGNFVWELNIVIRYRSYSTLFVTGVTAWAFIDAALILSYLIFCIHDKKRERIAIFLAEVIFYFAVMYAGFAAKSEFYMLSSLFVGFIMSLAFVFYAIYKKILPNNLSVAAGITRLLGELAAWLMYPGHPVVRINGILVFVCNVVYLFFLIRQNIIYRSSQV